ncbi:MAG TPA: FAD-dependent oxidoreductase, partial [Candidatus Omnitrophota bacterium]|nr:FAD-dependent oxidoreductase [Candidatus Omnitrophota bacterium]
MSERKTGVYLCSGCGIGDSLNMAALEGVAKTEYKLEPKAHACLCADEGVAMIRADVEAGTNQVVVAACSSRVMTDRFAFEPAAQVIRVDLREKVTWSHPAGDEDTQMLGEDYLRMGLSHAPKVSLPEPWIDGEYSQRIMVLGGGVTGLTAATEAAALGHDVLLVERSDRLGGHALEASKRLPHTPPYDKPEANGVEALVASVKANGKITVKMSADVTRTAGMPGKFAVTFAD